MFSPQNWGYTARNPEKAYYADCPTLQKYDEFYGEGNAEFWIYGQVIALFGSSSSKDSGVVDGITIFAQSFASQVKIYKLSELMLFFAARRIGNAFFKEFIPERSKEIESCERKRRNEEALNRRELPKGYIVPDGYNTYTWYKEILRRASSGDQEAINLLKSPVYE